MDYLLVKQIHISCALLSICGFAWRGLLMLRQSELLRKRWLRILPHVVDSILLLSAGYLAWRSSQYPFADAWLSAKLFALLAYIGFGMLALRHGRSRPQRVAAFIAALLTVCYLLLVARTRNPLLFW